MSTYYVQGTVPATGGTEKWIPDLLELILVGEGADDKL